MARRLNSVAVCVIIGLCILLIYASNRISSPPFSSAPPDEYIRSIKTHRQYHHQQQQPQQYHELDSNRHNVKYNQLMHPHNTDQRGQYFSRRFGGSVPNVDIATAETTNFINTSVRIEDVIDAQRHRIANKMKDFEYTDQMIGLSALTPETNGQPIQSG